MRLARVSAVVRRRGKKETKSEVRRRRGLFLTSIFFFSLSLFLSLSFVLGKGKDFRGYSIRRRPSPSNRNYVPSGRTRRRRLHLGEVVLQPREDRERRELECSNRSSRRRSSGDDGQPAFKGPLLARRLPGRVRRRPTAYLGGAHERSSTHARTRR